MNSKDYQDFVSSCFPKTYGQWHDGLNVNALFRLAGVELLEAEKLILSNIRRPSHSNNSIEAAGYLRLRSASELLKRELRATQVKRVLEAILLSPLFVMRRDYYHGRIVKIAWALYRIEEYPNSLSYIISEIRSSKRSFKMASFFQTYAFRALISFGHEPEAVKFLGECLHNPKFAFNAMYALESIRAGFDLGFLIPMEASIKIYEEVKRKLVNIRPFEWAVRT
jgi:hypothetical protein